VTRPPIPPKVATTPLGNTPMIITPQATFLPPVFDGDLQPSIIHPDFSGVNLVTGIRGYGKTSYGLKTDNPANILMLDYEDKGALLAQPLGVGGYFQIMTEVVGQLGDKFELQAVYDRTLQILNAVPEGRFTTLFIDNAQDLQDGSAQLIRNNPAVARRYGVRPENAESGGYGGAWPGVKYLIKNMFHLANGKGIKVIVVSFQLKGAWKDGKPLFNKFKTTDLSIWHERSILTLAMVEPMPEHFPIPRALVMKEQLSKMEWVPGNTEKPGYTRQIRRLPMALPKAEPRYVYEYLDNPANFADPKPGEMVTAVELAPYTPTFSNEQLIMMEKMLRLQQAMTPEED
jgi:hypothetical protein